MSMEHSSLTYECVSLGDNIDSGEDLGLNPGCSTC